MRKDGRTDGRTDMTKLIVAFPNFVNPPKNHISRFEVLFSCNLSN